MGTCLSGEEFEIDIPYIQMKQSGSYYQESTYKYHESAYEYQYCSENAVICANKGKKSFCQDHTINIVDHNKGDFEDPNILNARRKQLNGKPSSIENISAPDYIQIDSELHRIAEEKHSRTIYKYQESTAILDYIGTEAHTLSTCNNVISQFQGNIDPQLLHQQPSKKCFFLDLFPKSESQNLKRKRTENFNTGKSGLQPNLKISEEIISKYIYTDKFIIQYGLRYYMTESAKSFFKCNRNLHEITTRHFNNEMNLVRQWCGPIDTYCRGLNSVAGKEISRTIKGKFLFMQEDRFPFAHIDRFSREYSNVECNAREHTLVLFTLRNLTTDLTKCDTSFQGRVYLLGFIHLNDCI